AFYPQVPVVQYVAQHDDISLRKGIVEETPRDKFDSPRQSVGFDVLFKNRPHFRQIESSSLDVGIGQRHLCNQIALSSPNIDSALVFAPWEFPRNLHIGSTADASHCLKEFLQSGGIGIKSHERVVAAVFGFVLWESSTECCR